jgi:cell division septation protein DedD
VSPKAFGSTVPTDLYNPPRESGKTAHPDFPQVSSSFSGASLKPAYSKPIEEKPQISGRLPAEDPYQKYNELQQSFSKREGSMAGVLARAGSFFQKFTGLNRLVTRQVIYWTAGVLVVFFLFWGVNALNVGREQAMKIKYHAPDQTQIKTEMPSAVLPQEKALTLTDRTTEQLSEESSKSISIPEASPVKTQPADKPAAVASTKRFVIQVVTYPTQDYAERIVTTLKQAGFSAYVKENTRPTGTTFFVVLIGNFRTAAEAQQQLSKFRASETSRPFSDAFVRTGE